MLAELLLAVAVEALARILLVVWRELDGLVPRLCGLLWRGKAAEKELFGRNEMLPGERLLVLVARHHWMADRLAVDRRRGEDLDGLDLLAYGSRVRQV